MSGLNLAGKRYFPVFLRANTELTFPQTLIHGVAVYQARFQKKLTIANLSLLSGLSQPTVGSALAQLKTKGLLNGNYEPIWDTADNYFLTKHKLAGKSGADRYVFFVYFPPSPDSPLSSFQHSMYSFLGGTTATISHINNYVVSQLKLDAKTVAEGLNALQNHDLMDERTLYPPDDEQMSYFQDAGQILKKKKEALKLASEPLSVIKQRQAMATGRLERVAKILGKEIDSEIEGFCERHSEASDSVFVKFLGALEEAHLKGRADSVLKN